MSGEFPAFSTTTAGREDSLSRPRVAYAFDLGANHYHLSLLYTGLAQLATAGSIELDWRLGPAGELDTTSTGGMVARLLVEHEGQSERLAIDLFDRSDTFHAPTLAWCDRYLKRSCYSPDIQAHAGPNGHKVEPFGMNYACRSLEADRLVKRSIVRQATSRGLRSPLATVRQVLGQRNLFRTYLSLPKLKDFEAPPDAPREDRVLFQTRVWAPEEVLPDDPEEINGVRAETVRALRQEFGPRFLGGLVPTPYAREHYPDLLTTASTRRRDFIDLVKTSRVLVYTRGLHHSIAFKLPEYLAASGVIVSEPIRNELPAPLVAGEHFRASSSIEETAQLVSDALRDHSTRRDYSRLAYEYYQEFALPQTVCKNGIDVTGCRLSV